MSAPSDAYVHAMDTLPTGECEKCGARSQVHETRTRASDKAIRRTRHCPSCGHSWGTIEIRSSTVRHTQALMRSAKKLAMLVDEAVHGDRGESL